MLVKRIFKKFYIVLSFLTFILMCLFINMPDNSLALEPSKKQPLERAGGKKAPIPELVKDSESVETKQDTVGVQYKSTQKSSELVPERVSVESKTDQQTSETKDQIASETLSEPVTEESASEPDKKTLSIKVPKANIRDNASFQAKINTQLEKGEAVVVLETKDDWYHVQLSDGETGWAHKKLFTDDKDDLEIQAHPGDQLDIQVSLGNIREEPSLEAEVIKKVKKGDKAVVQKIKNAWYNVKFENGTTGWAHKILFAKSSLARKAQTPHLLKGIRIEAGKAGEEKIYFVFKGIKPPKTFFTKTGPARLVCDFPNTQLGKGINQENPVNGNLVKNVRTGLHNKDNTDARIVFDLVPDQKYELEHIFIKGQVYMLIVKKVTT